MTKLILAVQADTTQKAKKIFSATEGWIDIYKIGIDLYTYAGSRLIDYLLHRDAKVFLDLKFCDIPSIVAAAAEVCVRLGVSMFTIHTMGGEVMMKQTVDHLKEYCAKKRIKQPPLVIGVTVLTSISEREFKNVWGTKSKAGILGQVLKLSGLAKKCGLDGVVCASKEIEAIKKECGKDFITVVPGIRVPPSMLSEEERENEMQNITNDDQSRIATPAEAAKLGADYIVIGRPIIRAIDKVSLIEKILQDLKIYSSK
ncbi:MAG: orotidine-5'-phosphate decarboxylase [candidate division WOR-3 bacterium]|nr:orotidine-5'-phosphate decarboxylase [candidate division WOR-3 bacterium]